MLNDNPFGGLGFLDAMSVTAFCAQLANMDEDAEHTKWMQQVIKAIAAEINLIHEEDRKIIKQNEEIIKLLKKEEIKPHATN